MAQRTHGLNGGDAMSRQHDPKRAAVVNRKRRECLTALALSPLAAAIGTSGSARAQGSPAYPNPSRPISLICPWQAGGPTDAVFRSLAEAARAGTRQPSHH